MDSQQKHIQHLWNINHEFNIIEQQHHHFHQFKLKYQSKQLNIYRQ